jgi:chromosome segregation ATPase
MNTSFSNENTEQEILSLKNIIISLRKSNREYNELLDQQYKQIESLQQDIAKKLDTNSRLREENRQLKLEIEKLFDNWALGNYPEPLFFSKLQILIHKIQQS